MAAPGSWPQAGVRHALCWLAPAAALAWSCAWLARPEWAPALRPYQASFFALAWLVTLAALAGEEPRARAYTAWLFAAAAACRVALSFHAPPFSPDIYRYLWDARVWAHGVNPFRYTPLDPHLVALHDTAVWPRINYPELPTIYPVVDQLFFLLASRVAPGVTGLKLLLGAVELAGLAVLRRALRARGLPGAWALLLAFHPLALAETSANGHADALGATLLLCGLLALPARRVAGAAGAALAALAKWNALVVLPALRLSWRGWVVAAALVAAGAACFAAGGVNPFFSVGQYLGRWRWNDSLFWLLMQATHDLVRAKIVAGVALGAWVLFVARREKDPVLAARSALGAWLLLTPSCHPWYALWLLPLVALSPEPGWLWLLAALPLAYGPWPGRLAQKQEELTLGLRLLEFGPAFAWWIVAAAAGAAGRRAAPARQRARRSAPMKKPDS